MSLFGVDLHPLLKPALLEMNFKAYTTELIANYKNKYPRYAKYLTFAT